MGTPLPAWRIIAGLSSGVDVDDRQVLALLAAGPLSSVQLAQALAQPVTAVDARMAGLHAAGVALQHDGSHWQLQQLPDLHDEGRIRQALAVHVSRSLAGLEVLWQVDSTNSELLRRPPVADGFQVLPQSMIHISSVPALKMSRSDPIAALYSQAALTRGCAARRM